MTASQPLGDEHLSNDLLVRSMDEELSGSETIQVERHLSACEECRERLEGLRVVSDQLSALMQSLRPTPGIDERAALAERMDRFAQKEPVYGTGKTLARFGWVLAAAATVAISVSYLPSLRQAPVAQSNTTVASAVSQAGAPFEIDGETFQYLPYSNPDLPLGGSHIVQMQVPLSSLADAGVLVQPSANRITMPDRAVLADVLLGLDGQPIGVHVLTAD